LSKLEDLFRSGFIIEDEYRQRKDELLGAAAGKPSAAPGEKPKEDPKEEEKATEKHAHAGTPLLCVCVASLCVQCGDRLGRRH
jgi:hypothetical protein